MDDLDNLPETQNNSTPQEIQVLQKYFNDAAQSSGSAVSKGKSGPTNWKFIAYTTGLFILLANPFIDKMLNGFPYLGGESMVQQSSRLIVKGMLFFIIFFFIQRYLA